MGGGDDPIFEGKFIIYLFNIYLFIYLIFIWGIWGIFKGNIVLFLLILVYFITIFKCILEGIFIVKYYNNIMILRTLHYCYVTIFYLPPCTRCIFELGDSPIEC